jgi:hypothetical protein
MSDLAIQASFNTGEWAPSLYARVDLAKYRSGAALLSNFFVDYRGGASTRPGTKYILQCYKSATPVRLIPMQVTFSLGYILEFGDKYIRFFVDGAPILETASTITAATAGPPEVFTDAGHGYVHGDWVFVQGNYYIVRSPTTNTFTLADLFANDINTNPFTLPTTAARVYTIASPYAAADLAVLKFAQNVNELILCHPSYAPQVLTIITAANWTILPIIIGSTSSPPIPSGISGNFPSPGSNPSATFYAYVITSIDANGQESSASSPTTAGPTFDLRDVAGSLSISWTPVAGAVGYNVYKADVSYIGVVPPGATFGFIGTTTGTNLIDSNIGADFSQTPPIAKNPFQGQGIASVAVTNSGTYTAVPTLTVVGSSTIVGSLAAVLQVHGTPTIGAGGTGYVVGDLVSFTNGVTLVVATLSGSAVATWAAVTATGSNPGTVNSGATPANPVAQLTTSGVGTGATANLVWGVGQVLVLNPGAGYATTPTVSASPASTFASTVTLSPTSNGNPSVPGFFQQRLVLAAPNGAPQTFYMSQPGAYFNFNVSNPSEATDSITGTLVSGQLNTIKSMISQTTGLLILTDKASWLITGGGNGTAVSPSALVANAQSFNGASDVPPIVSNFDVLYVQSKGSIVRDSAYNIYANVFTGTDISVISSHLFYGFTVQEWAWAEEPFKVVWAIRNDGVMLTLTFLKEQDFTAWCHSSTPGGLFKSVATVTEGTATAGEVDAIYTVVARTIESNAVQYIERVAERTYPNGVVDAWTVDCAIQYVGSPATAFSGAQFLAGQTVTGLADGKVITPFVMPSTGAFTLPVAASKVTVGIGFTAQLQTLALDLGEPTVQGKVKKINNVDVRVTETLGLTIGSDFNHLVPMKDLVQGNVSSMLTGQASQIITDLVTGDARTALDPTYTVPGQYCIQQSLPYPATILGVFPSITQGDQGSRG